MAKKEVPRIPHECACLCHVCGKGDRYYKGCHCNHECCMPLRAK